LQLPPRQPAGLHLLDLIEQSAGIVNPEIWGGIPAARKYISLANGAGFLL